MSLLVLMDGPVYRIRLVTPQLSQYDIQKMNAIVLYCNDSTFGNVIRTFHFFLRKIMEVTVVHQSPLHEEYSESPTETTRTLLFGLNDFNTSIGRAISRAECGCMYLTPYSDLGQASRSSLVLVISGFRITWCL